MILNKNKLIILLAVIGAISIWPEARGWNDWSRMATIQSIVEDQSIFIDNSIFAETGDKVFINEHFYSDKPIMPSLIGSAVYYLLYNVGIKLDLNWNLAYYIITLLTIKFFWLCGILAFFSLLKYTSMTEKWKYLLTFSMGVGSLYFTWSSTFNNHSLAASFIIIGIFFIVRAGYNKPTSKYIFSSGLFLSLAGTCDIPVAVFYVGYLVYIFFDKHLAKNYFYFLFPLLLTVLPTLLINYYISNSFIPVQIIKSNFEYTGSPWIQSGNLDNLSGISINSGMFIFLNAIKLLISHKGFLIYNPLLFIAIPCLWYHIVSKGCFFKHAIVTAAASIIILIYYILFTKGGGGWSYSVRWFVPLLPVLYIYIFSFFDNINSKKKLVFYTLSGISTVIALIGLINPWSILSYSRIPIVANIFELIHIINNI